MPETETEASPALKEIFNRDRIGQIAADTAALSPGFDGRRFLALAGRDLDSLGIMQRLRQIASSLGETLPGDFERQVELLYALAPRIGQGFASLVLPEFVALRGRSHFAVSMEALKFFTPFGSSEFAVRPFLQDDLTRTLAVMEGWSCDENEHVRRLASEGSRPRLPWSFQLKPVIADPALTAAILENLRSDPSAYVRKSVANHLNDISKDNPDWMLARVAAWPRDDRATAWIARHALRSLIKQGDQRALALVGAAAAPEVRIEGFRITPSALRLGETLTLEARVVSLSSRPQTLVVDYALHYVRKGGGSSRKVFKLKLLSLPPLASADLAIRQTIRDFSTRRHYPGRHRVELLVNGRTLAEGTFDLAS